MNRCFLTINLDGFSENASGFAVFFQKKAFALRETSDGAEKNDFLGVSTGKMRFLSYLIWINVCAPESERTFFHENH